MWIWIQHNSEPMYEWKSNCVNIVALKSILWMNREEAWHTLSAGTLAWIGFEGYWNKRTSSRRLSFLCFPPQHLNSLNATMHVVLFNSACLTCFYNSIHFREMLATSPFAKSNMQLSRIKSIPLQDHTSRFYYWLYQDNVFFLQIFSYLIKCTELWANTMYQRNAEVNFSFVLGLWYLLEWSSLLNNHVLGFVLPSLAEYAV